MTKHCPYCEREVQADREFNGSYAALILLLIVGIGPGVIYYVIRRERFCEECGNVL